MTPTTPTVTVGGIAWTYAGAYTVMEGGAMPDGSQSTQAEQQAAGEALAIMRTNGALYGVPGSVVSSNWPTTPPAAPPPHQAAGAAASIAASGISPLVLMGGAQESQSYTSYLQQLDDYNWGTTGLTGWSKYSLDYANAATAFNSEGGTNSFPSIPPNPTYRIGADFATYHASWIQPLPPPASPDNPGGAEPPYTLVTAATVSTFDYSAATAAKHKSSTNNVSAPIAVVIPTSTPASAAPAQVINLFAGMTAQQQSLMLALLQSLSK